MSAVAVEIIIILLLIFANGLFSMAEMAIVSARKIRLQQMVENGDAGAQPALNLAEQPSRFLSTVQVGITMVGILTGAVGGATIAEELAKVIGTVGFLQPYSEAIAVVVVVLIITYFSLVLGELVPKRLALGGPEQIATWMAPAMTGISRLATPLVALLTWSTDAVVRLLRVKQRRGPDVTEEDVKMMIYEGTQDGIFEEAEQEIMRRVFRLGDRKVSTLMTYRADVIWLDVEDPDEVNIQKIATSGHSRYPVCRGDLDTVLGIILVNDLFSRSQNGEAFNLELALHDPLFLTEAMDGLEALEKLRGAREHEALVIDEFGSVSGLIAASDLLEAIVGEMPSIAEGEEPEVVRRDDGSWLLDGLLPVDEVKELLELNQLPHEEEGNYETLGGMIMTELGRIPHAGDLIEYDSFKFEVMDMDGYRVDKVLVIPTASPNS